MRATIRFVRAVTFVTHAWLRFDRITIDSLTTKWKNIIGFCLIHHADSDVAHTLAAFFHVFKTHSGWPEYLAGRFENMKKSSERVCNITIKKVKNIEGLIPWKIKSDFLWHSSAVQPPGFSLFIHINL